jgi:hypothetical protein
MSTKTYDTLEGQLSVRPTPTVTQSSPANSVAIIGGYDADNAAADVNAGEATAVRDPVDASDQFGDCEITRAASVMTANGAGDIRAVPVPETEITESIISGSDLTLSYTPFDPNLHPDHTITVTDTTTSTDLTINITYSDPVPVPSESDTANVNPLTQTVEVDSSGDYDVTYTYGEYTSAIQTAADLQVRYVCPLTESPSVKADTVATLNNVANDFDFKRAVVGAKPEIEPVDIGNYTPDERSWRMVEVAPARAGGADGAVRTQAAVAGLMAAQPLGPDGSTLFDSISGITTLNKRYRGTDAKGFDGVTSITRTAKIAQAVTTSEAEQFSNVYATEIVDAVALRLFSAAESYAGGPQDVGELETLLRGVCLDASSGNPPLLGFGRQTDERPFDIGVSVGADSSVANASVTIVPTPIAEEVNIDLTVADGFVSFSGAQ